MSTFSVIILYVLFIAVEAVFTPLFLKAQRNGICIKSFCFKMICASMFMLLGILSWQYSSNSSEFAKFILISLALSWFGDMFLHIKTKYITFAVGFCFFTAAHVVYIISYSKAWKQYLPDKSFFSVIDILLFFGVFLGAYLYIKFKKKMPIKGVGVPVCVGYGLVLVTMLVKAVTFSVNYIVLYGTEAIAGAACLALGGICFFMSDASLALLLFNPADKGRIGLKNHNIATYFLGQSLLALSILFIGG